MTTSTSPASVFSRLRGRAARGIVTEGVALVGFAFVAFMLVSFALDRTLRLEGVYRACMLLVFALVGWRLLNRHLFRPLRVELNDDELALALERGEEGLSQALISAVQFERALESGAPANESTELMREVVTSVRERLPGLHDNSALDVNRVRKFATIILGCLAVVGTWGIVDAGSLATWARRNLLMSSVEWPRASQLSFFNMDARDGVLRVAEGNDLAVEVLAGGVIPEQVFIHYEFAGGAKDRDAMKLAGASESAVTRRFVWLLESVISDVTLYATGGDGLTETLEVQLVKRPTLQNLVIKQTFPAYMKREDEVVEPSAGDVRLPAGVVLTISGASSKPVETAFLQFGQDVKRELSVAGDQSDFTGTLVPEKSGVLTIDVSDTDGLGLGKPPKIFLRVTKDQAPVVDYRTTGIGSMILYKARIPGTLKTRDDFGLTKITARLRISGGDDEIRDGDDTWAVAKFEGLRQPSAADNETDYAQPVLYDLANVNDIQKGPTDPSNPIRPGMLLQFSFEVQDNFGPGDPHMGKGEILSLRVVTEEKLMQDLHRRQAERRRELMQILEKEKNYKAELEEIVSPGSDDPRAKLAKLRLHAIARDQRALTKQLAALAKRYQKILDEYLNNRVLKPTLVRTQRQGIQFPMEKLAKEDFPESAEEVEDFAHRGIKDIRTVAIASYGSIISILERVISNMRHLESVAGILDEIRKARDRQIRIKQGTQKILEKEDPGAKDVEKKKGKKE